MAKRRVKPPRVGSISETSHDNIPWKMVVAFLMHKQKLSSFTINYEEFNAWIETQLGGGLGLKDLASGEGVSFTVLSRADVALMIKPTPERTM